MDNTPMFDGSTIRDVGRLQGVAHVDRKGVELLHGRRRFAQTRSGPQRSRRHSRVSLGLIGDRRDGDRLLRLDCGGNRIDDLERRVVAICHLSEHTVSAVPAHTRVNGGWARQRTWRQGNASVKQ